MPTDFELRVYALCSRIPKGTVSTYGSMARALGSSARAVGGALRRNPFAPTVPCHRVVAADLSLGGFQGVKLAGAPELLRKEGLLRGEGVRLVTSSRGALLVDGQSVHTLDADEIAAAARLATSRQAALAAFARPANGGAGAVAKQVSPREVAASPAPKRARSGPLAVASAAAEMPPAARPAARQPRQPQPQPQPQQQQQCIIGIDWSGAADAGKHIVVAHGTLTPPTGAQPAVLRIESVVAPADAAHGATALEGACACVVGILLRLCESTPSEQLVTAGVDAPLGLPASLVAAAAASGPTQDADGGGWRALVDTFRARWPNADELRAWSLAESTRAQVGEREQKRVCDVMARTPFAPTNLRLYRQTWAALALLCAPLLAQRERVAVAVLPMMAASGARLRLLEACPASLLKRSGLYDVPYKGTTPAHAAARRRLVEHARAVGFQIDGAAPSARGGDGGAGAARVRVECALDVEAMLVAQPSADALDAVLTAAGTACSVLRRDFPAPVEGAHAAHALEGAVYC